MGKNRRPTLKATNACRSITLRNFPGKFSPAETAEVALTHTPRGSKRTYLGGVPKTTGTTDDIGAYVMDTDLPAGRCSVAPSKLGFATRTKAPMAVSAGATSYANLYHVGPAQRLAYVVSLGVHRAAVRPFDFTQGKL